MGDEVSVAVLDRGDQLALGEHIQNGSPKQTTLYILGGHNSSRVCENLWPLAPCG